MFSTPVPVFDSVVVITALDVFTAWFPNASVVGESEATGAGGAVPVPVSAAICGDPVALSLTLNVAVSAPTRLGVNVA
jgi:hypothetical protein